MRNSKSLFPFPESLAPSSLAYTREMEKFLEPCWRKRCGKRQGVEGPRIRIIVKQVDCIHSRELRGVKCNNARCTSSRARQKRVGCVAYPGRRDVGRFYSEDEGELIEIATSSRLTTFADGVGGSRADKPTPSPNFSLSFPSRPPPLFAF